MLDIMQRRKIISLVGIAKVGWLAKRTRPRTNPFPEWIFGVPLEPPFGIVV
jgi:hypothetical protein